MISFNYQLLKKKREEKEVEVYAYEIQREILNQIAMSPEQQQPFHQRISEPADPFCRVSCSVHVEPLYREPPVRFT
ncbi:MAG: hypothetical protein AAB579_02810, partial [Patescibacteria group bacterium]